MEEWDVPATNPRPPDLQKEAHSAHYAVWQSRDQEKHIREDYMN